MTNSLGRTWKYFLGGWGEGVYGEMEVKIYLSFPKIYRIIRVGCAIGKVDVVDGVGVVGAVDAVDTVNW